MKDSTHKTIKHGQLGEAQLTVMGIDTQCLESRAKRLASAFSPLFNKKNWLSVVE
jgi:hypothetical protein